MDESGWVSLWTTMVRVGEPRTPPCVSDQHAQAGLLRQLDSELPQGFAQRRF